MQDHLRTVCQILFRISQSNGTKEIQKRISQIQFPIESTLKKRNMVICGQLNTTDEKKERKKKTDSSENTNPLGGGR